MSNQLARGATWMVSMRWVVRGLGLISMVVLARLLSPDDFGVFAIGLIVLGFIEFLAEGGIEFALIREQSAKREHFDSAWTVQIILGLLTGALIFASAPLVAYLFDEPRAVPVLQILALRPVCTAFTNIGVVSFLKEFDFRKEFLFDVTRRVMDATITIVLAVTLRNYMALVIGAVAGAAFGAIFSYVIHPYRPRLSLKKVREIWSFSGWLVVSYAAEEISDLVDRIVVGAIAATNMLGLYHMAGTISAVIMQNTIFPLWRGLFPAYAKIAHEPEELAAAFYPVFGWVVVVSCVAGFGISSVAPDLVVTLLGEKWAPAIPLVPWLTVAVAIAGVVDNPLLILTALGRTRLIAIQSIIRVVMVGTALPLAGMFWGVEGVAIAVFVVATLHAPIPFYFLIRNSPVTLRDIIRRVWRPLTSGGVMYVVVRIVAEALDGHYAVVLSIEIAAGAATFIVCSLLLWVLSGRPPGPEATFVGQARKRLRVRRVA
ncbi:MAG: lipopolysaccharide biosynthesis protein [Alphaproteobacteria bacterium]|nr:lipopolysaccharide biosynthesis protein [Alphaproteobacteria bacterium]